MSSQLDESIKLTPMMEQWRRCKQSSSGALLFFRMGDFYETFYEDARVVAEELDLTLTQRQGIPMSGVPWHTCDTYIDKLVGKGYRVAIAEQTEEAKEAKGLVNREIVRFITPGTLIGSELIKDKNYNFILSIAQVGSVFGLAVCDITTSSFRVLEVEEIKELQNELYRLNPSEIVISKKFHDKQSVFLKESEPVLFTILEEWRFEHQAASRYLTKHFQVSHLDGFGLKGMVAAINAAGALLAYIHDELSLSIEHIRDIKPYFTKDILLLDRTCQRNLELTEPLHDPNSPSTLLSVIDFTVTPMGGRLLKEWLKKPLVNVAAIQKRLDGVEALIQQNALAGELAKELRHIRDLERVMMKISSQFATPRDMAHFGLSLTKIGPIKRGARAISSELLFQLSEKLTELPLIEAELQSAFVADPPVRITEGHIFREGYHAKLDELRSLMHGGKEWLAAYQTRLKEETGIKTLKVSFNKIFGYYIEVSKAQTAHMPPSFERRQTLVNCERFISPELKSYENTILSAEEQMIALENRLFLELRSKVAQNAKTLFETAEALAQIDVLLSLAQAAQKGRFSRPLIDESHQLYIEEGRHPVVERAQGKENFIPNDTQLTENEEKMMLITGPNMAGKSTYIRQVALIVILAQMGSFVPAKKAHIGIVDQIFARIGASDNLSKGQSTFMVEMSETATILNHVTDRSLVILDEIGRGTSTYDGLSIAWAVAEYLLERGAKTLFATHYWELTDLEKMASGVVNYHASVQEWNEEIVFLHKIIKGGTDRSYGIQVARLAGLPLPVIQRAGTILKKLEARKETARRSKKESLETQLLLF